MHEKKETRIISHTLILAAMTSVAAFCVRLLFFSGGVRGSDAYAYAYYAYQIATGTYDPAQVFSFYGFRYTVLLPTAMAYKIFGVGDIPSIIFPYLFSSLHAGMLFLLVHRVIGRREALIAACLIVFYPLDVCTANILGPDAFIPFFATSALLCYWGGEKRNHSGLLFFSGILIGIATLSRVTSIFLLLAITGYHLLKRFRLRSLFWLWLGLFIPIMVESFFYFYGTGDAFLHYHRLSVHDDLVKGTDPDAIVSLSFYPRVMFGFDLTGLALYGPLWWLVVYGLYIAWKERNPALLLLVCALVIPWLGFEFGRQNLREMTPIMKNYNYLSLITGPAISIASYGVSSFFNEKRKKALWVGFISIVAIMNLYGAYRVMENVKDDAAPYEVVARFLQQAEKRPVYVHHERWVLFLGYFLKYDPSWDLKLVKSLPGRTPLAYLILHRRYLERDTAGRPIEPIPLARFWENPPPSWEKKVAYQGRPAYNSVIVYALSESKK